MSLECMLFSCKMAGAQDQDRNTAQKGHKGVPVVVQWLTNLTRNHEVAGLIPGLVQWVKDLALP